MKRSPITSLSNIAACAAALFAFSSAQAATYGWTQTAGGTYQWDDPTSNWTTGFPNATGDVANITGDFAGAQIINLNQAITVGTLSINDTGASTDSSVTIATGTPGGSLTFSVASGSASLTNSSINATSTISAPVVFTSNTSINPGNSSSSANLTTISLSGGFSGAGNITVGGTTSGTGRSTVTLGGANTGYTGNWTLNGSTATSVDAGAGISISQDSNLGAVPGSPTTNITVTSGVIRFTAGFTMDANRNILLNGTLGLIQTGAFTTTIAGDISGAGGIRANSSGSGRIMVLSGSNSYTGATTVNSGNLRAGSTSAFGNNSAVTISDTAVAGLSLNGFSNSIGSLSGVVTGGNGAVSLGSGTLTTGGLNTNTSYSGIISGTGGFSKVGTGIQTLSGANTYTGVTTVSAGTLLVSGGLTGTTSISVSGGTLQLGASDALNDAATLTLSGGTLDAQTFSDTLGVVTLSGNSFISLSGGTISFADSSAATWGSFTLDITGFVSGASLRFGTTSSGLVSSQLLKFTASGFDTFGLDASGFLTATAVPEPATWALLAASLTTVVIFRRRRNS